MAGKRMTKIAIVIVITATAIMSFYLFTQIKTPNTDYRQFHVLSVIKPWMNHFSTIGSHDKQKPQLVCSIAILNNGKYVLFTTGFRRNEVTFSNCIVENKTAHGRRIGPDMFECDARSSLNEDDVLSIQLLDGRIVPSLAVWSDRTPLSRGNHPKLPLCIMAMMKNESGKIADWIEYHIKQGVGLFVVYNNNSTDTSLAELQKYPQVVTLDWPWRKSKVEAIIHGVLHMREVCEWVFHTDVDEYMFPTADNASYTMKEVMMQFPMWINTTEKVGNPSDINQICLDTKVMGTSGYIRCPKLPVAEAYIDFETWWLIKYGKCAVRPKHIKPLTNVHRFKMHGRTYRLVRNTAYLVHYKYQCWEYFMSKWDKGRASASMKDWDKRSLNRDRPQDPWKRASGPLDTAFRDYKRNVDKLPLL